MHLNCLAGLEAQCLFLLLLYCSLVWANQSVLRREGPPSERTAQDRDRATLYMAPKSDDAGDENASTKRKDEVATKLRGFSFEKSFTDKALGNASCELGCKDEEDFKSKMMTDGTSAKYENVEETTAKALRNARRSFSGDEELFKNKNGQGVYQHGVTNRNGLEFDQKHDNDFAPSEVDLGQKYNEVHGNCQEDVFTGWPGTLELETEKNELNLDRLEFDSNVVTKNKQRAREDDFFAAPCFVNTENNVGPDGEVFEVVKEMKIMFMMPNKIFTGVCTSNTKHGERRPAGCPPDPRVSGLDSQNDKRRDDRLREDHVGQIHDLFRDKTKW